MLWIFAERFFMAALRQCEKSEGCFAVFTAQPWTAAVLFKLQFSDGLLAETMGRFRFRKPAQRVIKRDFHGIVGAKSIGTSGYHTKFVVEALDGTVGYLSFGTKPFSSSSSWARSMRATFCIGSSRLRRAR